MKFNSLRLDMPLICLAITVCLLGMFYPTQAAPGDLDTSFGTLGRVIAPLSNRNNGIYDLAIQADGRIVAVGYDTNSNGTIRSFAVARFNSNGSSDSGFGNGGTLLINFGGFFEEAHSIAIQSDGKLIVAGFTRNNFYHLFAVARLNPNGALDSSFGNNGKVTTAVRNSDDDRAFALALQADGKILLAGTSRGVRYDLAIVRYNNDGSPDTTFGSAGKVITLGGSDNQFNAIAVQSDGKVVALGERRDTGVGVGFLYRYHQNGVIDEAFGINGQVSVTGANAIKLQSDGQIITAGYAYFPAQTNFDFCVSRRNSNGSPDISFGTNGIVVTPIRNGHDVANDVAVQPDGKIVVAGYSWDGQKNIFALARYNAGGGLDTAFGTAGIVLTSVMLHK